LAGNSSGTRSKNGAAFEQKMEFDADRSAKTYDYTNDLARCASSGLLMKDF